MPEYICACCGNKVILKRRWRQNRFTCEGKLIPSPFICQDCLDDMEESEDPEEVFDNTIAPFSPKELDTPLLV